MKNIIPFCFFLLVSIQAKSQISIEATYENAASSLYMVKLEVDGDKYVKVERDSANRFITLYNLDHSVFKSMNCNSFPYFGFMPFEPNGPGNFHFDALYITQHLFDTDDEVEFMYTVRGPLNHDQYTGIYNENSSLIFAQDSAGPYVSINIPIVAKPIYNTPNGTKMILSFPATNQAKVYSLQGTLTTSEISLTDGANVDGNLEAYPNPASRQITMSYKLPIGTKKAEIIVSDLSGKEIKKYNIDNAFNDLLVSASDFSEGIYVYSLKVNGEIIETKKMVIKR